MLIFVLFLPLVYFPEMMKNKKKHLLKNELKEEEFSRKINYDYEVFLFFFFF
jgi:hypothetical protein